MSPSQFSRQLKVAYGETPSAYRARNHEASWRVPACYSTSITCPSR
jgi:AraC-like DNA-binding protein